MTEQHGDPQRFPPGERLEPVELARIELSGHGPPIFVDHSFECLRVELGADGETPSLEIVSGIEWPQLHARFVVTQPAVLAEDPRRGWAPVGGIYPPKLVLGARSTPQFAFSELLRSEVQLLVRDHETYLSLVACPSASAGVLVARRDVLAASQLTNPYDAQAA
jgi:hypothetical protein